MVANKINLNAMYVAMLTAFNFGLAGHESQWKIVATEIPSTTAANQYPWLGALQGVREWIGDRVVGNVALHDWTIKNKTWEHTIGIKRDEIEDDQYGVYTPLVQQQGQIIAEHPDTLTFSLLSLGFSERCYDGQYFFDTDHPVIGVDGVEQSVSNFGGGTGRAWYLIDDSRPLKPLIFQMRRKAAFTSKTKLDDDNVFDRNEFLFGVDGRWNVGFGLWQLAYASKQPLDQTNLEAAIGAMESQVGDNGRKLAVKAKILLVSSLDQFKAKALVAATLPQGGDNPLANAVRVVVCPWL